MGLYTSIYGKPSLPSNGRAARISRVRAAYLCRLVVSKQWTEQAFVRYLKFNGCYQTVDLLPGEYANAIIDLENSVLKKAFHGEIGVTDGRKRERRWHYELDRDEFYAAFSLSERSDYEVFDTINLTWSDAARASLAFKELKHRLDSYRHIAMILELQQGG